MKRVAKGLCLSLATVLLTLLGIELALRLSGYEPIVNPSGPRWMYEAASDLGYTLHPGFRGRHRHPEFDIEVCVDARGLRDLPYDGAPSHRVLVLGDSMVFGYGVEAHETFCEVLQRQLGAVDVINAGVSGYGPREQVAMLARHGATTELDLILSSFYPANDLRDAIDPPETVLGGLVFTERFAAKIRGSRLRSLGVHHSQLLLTLETVRVEGEAKRRTARPLESITIPGPDDPRAITGFEVFLADTPPEVERRWQVVREQYAALAAQAGERPLQVLYMPGLDELHDERWERQMRHFGIAPELVDRNRPFARLQGICDDLGLLLIDPRPALIEAGVAWEWYFPYNQHLTAEGNRRLAEALRPAIEAAIRP
ncbi:MAG: hypothetical protein AAFZ65_00620 [Planctomycetota bacterium]